MSYLVKVTEDRCVELKDINHGQMHILLNDAGEISIIPGDTHYTAELGRDECMALLALLSVWLAEYAGRGPEELRWIETQAKATQRAAERTGQA
jgi:hypothetical protein